jgi:hypothetical protein
MENGRQKASVALMAFQQDIATPLKQPPDRFIAIPFFFVRLTLTPHLHPQ